MKLEGKLFLNHYRMGYGVKQDLYYQGLINNHKEIEINESQTESELSGAPPRAGSSQRSKRSVGSVTSKGIHNTHQPMEVIKEQLNEDYQ